MKSILVPTDFSKNALNAVKYAFAYAEVTKSKVILFHSYDNPTSGLNIPFADIHIDKNIACQEAEKDMLKLQNSLSKSFPNVKQTWIVEAGFGADEITDYVSAKKIKLVIMGTTGQGAVGRAFIGSTTTGVIADASCDVIVVPPKAKFKGINKVGFATDIEDANLKLAFEAVAFAKQFSARLTVIYVQDLKIYDVDATLRKMLDKVRKHTKYQNVSFYVGSDDNIANGLNLFIKKNKPDILSMVTHSRKFPETIWKKSWTKKMSYVISVPLLILHAKQPKDKDL